MTGLFSGALKAMSKEIREATRMIREDKNQILSDTRKLIPCRMKRQHPGLIIKCCPDCQSADVEGVFDGSCCNHSYCNADCWVMCGDDMVNCPHHQKGEESSMNDNTLKLADGGKEL